MLPYIEPPTLDLGFTSVGAFHVLVGIAIVVQFQIVLRRAPKVGIDRRRASSLTGWAVLWGLLGAHVFDVVVYYPEKLVENPLELFRIWGGVSSFGGMISGLLGLFIMLQRSGASRAEVTRFFDCLIFALPFTLAIGRLGCALQHDHLGIVTRPGSRTHARPFASYASCATPCRARREVRTCGSSPWGCRRISRSPSKKAPPSCVSAPRYLVPGVFRAEHSSAPCFRRSVSSPLGIP